MAMTYYEASMAVGGIAFGLFAARECYRRGWFDWQQEKTKAKRPPAKQGVPK